MPSRSTIRPVEISNYAKIFHFFVSDKLFSCDYIYNKIKIESAARTYGLTDAELFQTIDLFEKRNIPQVTQCLLALGRHVRNLFVKVIV
jgi:hypothetical protein